MKTAARSLLFLTLFSPLLNAADKPLLLTGATVHPISGPALHPAQVLIRDGQIAAVAPLIQAPDATTLNLSGLHLYPGIIAPTTLAGLVEINAVRATVDTTEVGQFTPDVQSWIAVNPDSELIPVARANGITHILPVPMGGTISGQSGLLRMNGWTTEEMLLAQPVALHLFWPQMGLDTRPRSALKNKSKFKSLATQAKERHAQLQELDLFFREAKAYARSRQDRPDLTPSVPAWEAMMPYVRKEKPVMIHANEIRQIRSALAWAKTNDYQIVIAGGRDAWLATNELEGVAVIYEHVFTLPPYDWAPQDIQFRTPHILHQQGVTLCFSEGLDRSGAASLRNLPYAAAQAVAYGLPPAEALKGLTLHSAQVLGLDTRLGTIEPGKEASLVALDGDLLDIRSQVKHLWIAGREVPVQNRHTRLYDRYRQRPRPVAAP